jgi:hypothetical protein
VAHKFACDGIASDAANRNSASINCNGCVGLHRNTAARTDANTLSSAVTSMSDGDGDRAVVPVPLPVPIAPIPPAI